MTASIVRALGLGLVGMMCVAAGCGDDDPSGTDVGEDGGVDRDASADAGDARDAGDAGDEPEIDGGEGADGGVDGGARSNLTAMQLCMMLRAGAEERYCGGPVNEDCEEYLDASSERCEVVVQAVEDGRLRFDADAAQACLEGLTEIQLTDAFTSRYLPCESVFIGRIEEGEDCYFDYGFASSECVPSAYCDQSDGCPGTCTPYRREGQSCPTAGPCAPELACTRDCEPPCDGVCEPRPGEGDDCQATYGLCQSGLICDATTTPHSCLDPRDNGEACTRNWQCDSFWCSDGECAEPPAPECAGNDGCEDDEYCDFSSGIGMCEPARSEGQTCGGTQRCEDGLRCADDWSNGESMCIASAGEDGDPCLPFGCEDDHYCANEDDEHICRPARGMDQACEEPSGEVPWTPSCEPGLHCMLSSTGTCLPPSGMGGPCYYNDRESCEAGLVCMGYAASSCQLPSELDEECNPAFENACNEGYCRCEMIDDSCTWACAPQVENGEPCDDPAICESGYCDSSATPAVCADEPPQAMLCLPD